MKNENKAQIIAGLIDVKIALVHTQLSSIQEYNQFLLEEKNKVLQCSSDVDLKNLFSSFDECSKLYFAANDNINPFLDAQLQRILDTL